MLALSSGLQSHQAASGAGKPLSRAAKPSGEPRRIRILAKFEGARQKPRRRDATPLRRNSWKARTRSPDKTVRPARASGRLRRMRPAQSCGARGNLPTQQEPMGRARAQASRPLHAPDAKENTHAFRFRPAAPGEKSKRQTRNKSPRRKKERSRTEAMRRALKNKQKREIFFFSETPARCAGFFFSACPKLRGFAVRSYCRGAPNLRTGLRTGFCAPIVKTFLGRFAKPKNFSAIFQSIAKKNPSML